MTNGFANLTEHDEDEETKMLSMLGKIAHTVKTGPKPHQRCIDRSKPPKPLTKKQLDWVVAQVNSGKLKLPDLGDMD